MTRRKNMKIDPYVDSRRGVTVDIYLTPDDEFEAKVGADRLVCKTRDELNRLIVKAIQAQYSIEWYPVIFVEMLESLGSDGKDDTIGVQFEKFYLGKRADGRIAQVSWNISDEHRYANMKDYPYTTGQTSKFEFPLSGPWEIDASFHREFLMPYSDEVWQGLVSLREAIISLHARIVDILGTQEGHTLLTSVGSRLMAALPAPSEEDDDEDR